MKKKLAIIIPAAAVLILIAITVINTLGGRKVVEKEATGVPVVIENPERRVIEEILRYPATLTPTRTVTVVSKVPGRVVTIHVIEGSRVVPGQLLVTVDAESVSLQTDQAYAAWQAAEAQLRKAERGVRNEELENAQASFAQAEEEIEVANRNFERSQRLFAAGTISRSKFEEAESGIRAATTSLENARRSLNMMEEGASTEDLDAVRSQAEALKAQYDLAALHQKDATVTANSYGTVARLLVEQGNTVGMGTPLLALVSEHPIYAQISIPEKYYSRFSTAVGSMQVRIFPIAYDLDENFIGTVKTVAPLIDAQSRTFLVEASVPNLDGRLRPGMYANTEIVIETRENVMAIPESALVLRDDVQVVFVVEKGNSEHAMVRPIDIGIRSDGIVEIIGGIAPEARVVVDGNAFLEDGQLVRIVEAQ
jgi:HlyD family secretion protein